MAPGVLSSLLKLEPPMAGALDKVKPILGLVLILSFDAVGGGLGTCSGQDSRIFRAAAQRNPPKILERCLELGSLGYGWEFPK